MEDASPARLYASAAGAVLLIIGVLGFFYSASFRSVTGLGHRIEQPTIGRDGGRQPRPSLRERRRCGPPDHRSPRILLQRLLPIGTRSGPSNRPASNRARWRPPAPPVSTRAPPVRSS